MAAGVEVLSAMNIPNRRVFRDRQLLQKLMNVPFTFVPAPGAGALGG